MRNLLRKGETVEYLCRDINVFTFEVLELLDQDGIPLEQANPGNNVKIQYDSELTWAWEMNGLLRKQRKFIR